MDNMNEEDAARFKELNSALNAHQSWNNTFWPERSELAGALITDLMLAVDGQEIRYVSCLVNREVDVLLVTLVTESLFVHVSDKLSRAEQSRPTLVVRPLSKISGFRTQGTESALAVNANRTWPGKFSLTVLFDSGGEVKLPHEARGSVSDETTRLRSLYKSIRGRVAS